MERLSPEKGLHIAREIAKRSGWRLKTAGKVDVVDVNYFEQEIKPHIEKNGHVQHLYRV